MVRGSVYDSYNYNYKNQLYQTNTGAYFGYDADGQRVRSTLGGITTLTPTKEYSLEGSTPVKYVYGNGELVATVKDTGTSAVIHYAHTDHLTGSNIITNSSGVLEELLDYYPYGGIRLDEKAGSFAEKHQFIGQFYDADTGLNYLNARYYNATIGRFVSQNPVFLVMGDNGQIKQLAQQELQQLLADPQQLNSYAYARNDPIDLTDPQGLSIKSNLSYAYGFGYGAAASLYSNAGQFLQGLNPFHAETVYAPTNELSTVQPATISASSSSNFARTNGFTEGLDFGDKLSQVIGGVSLLIPFADVEIAGSRALSQLQLNKIKGDAFRDSVAQQLTDDGRIVQKEVVKPTLFGPRRMDLEVRDSKGTILGGVEAKTGDSRYTPSQRAKDTYLKWTGYPVNVIRDK